MNQIIIKLKKYINFNKLVKSKYHGLNLSKCFVITNKVQKIICDEKVDKNDKQNI